MGTFVNDTYTDAAGTLLENHTAAINSGGPATKITGLGAQSAVITAANRLRAATNAAVVGYSYAGAPGSADYDVSCDVFIASLPVTLGASAGVCARIQAGAETFYMARITFDPSQPFSGVDVFKSVAGTFTKLGQGAIPGGLVPGNTYKCKLAVRGTTIAGYYSTNGGATWGLAYEGIDASIAVAGTAGITFYSDLATSDALNFHVDNLTAVVGTVTILPNDPAWANSPGNWIVSGAVAVSTDFGAKRAITFTGTETAKLTFDLSKLTGAGTAGGSYPQIRYSVNNAPYTDVAMAATVAVLAGGDETKVYELVYEFVRGDYTVDSYTTPVMAIRETGLILDLNSTVSPPTDLYSGLIFGAGDSNGAGLNLNAATNPAGQDATATFLKTMAVGLQSEIGVGGKGGIGWAWPDANGSNVPAFTTSWKSAWNGQLRSFPAGLQIYAVNMGTNDAFNNITDAAVTNAVMAWIADARATLPTGCQIVIQIPVGGFKRAAINAGVAQAGDGNTRVVDLGTIFQENMGAAFGSASNGAPNDGAHMSAIFHGRAGAGFANLIAGISKITANSYTIAPRNSNSLGRKTGLGRQFKFSVLPVNSSVTGGTSVTITPGAGLLVDGFNAPKTYAFDPSGSFTVFFNAANGGFFSFNLSNTGGLTDPVYREGNGGGVYNPNQAAGNIVQL